MVPRARNTATNDLEKRRLAVVKTQAFVAAEVGFSRSKYRRVVHDPGRARHDDVLAVDAVLTRLERAAAGDPDFSTALGRVLSAERGR